MEFNPNFTYMLLSATAEDNVCHRDMYALFAFMYGRPQDFSKHPQSFNSEI
jgi:hypothetical protein